jgi:hypothetical protein
MKEKKSKKSKFISSIRAAALKFEKKQLKTKKNGNFKNLN